MFSVATLMFTLPVHIITTYCRCYIFSLNKNRPCYVLDSWVLGPIYWPRDKHLFSNQAREGKSGVGYQMEVIINRPYGSVVNIGPWRRDLWAQGLVAYGIVVTLHGGADRKSQSVKVLQCILWRRTKTEGGFVEWAVVFWL